ncbi:hypothetical protein ACCO45_007365 [Purpureocillium lilacinum]|uniref:Uncharacterized protein n=1 Tax=Purpureocillium lilacinum TaxID=33203 RepID=A0ACC4DSW8_PURLI
MTSKRDVASCHAMALRSSKSPKTTVWHLLPTEIRLLILEAIAQQKNPGWASFASVSREWQRAIATKNLGHLRLTEVDVGQLRDQIVLQRALVRRISLDIQLPRFSCQDSFFTSRHDAHPGALDPGKAPPDWHDEKHGWVDGKQVMAPPRAALRRLFEDIKLSGFTNGLPQVEAVTGLVIRRQLRRRIFPSLISLLMLSLTRLENLVYEPWRLLERDWRVVYDRHFQTIIQNNIPSTVRRVILFEDFNDTLAEAAAREATLPFNLRLNASRIVDAGLGMRFAFRSFRFEELSVSFMANAEDFFVGCKVSPGTWTRLRTLALTSQRLKLSGSGRKIDDLLLDAGETALRMPELRTMVLWNGGEGHACAFIYLKSREGATITWRGTWYTGLSPHVVDVWQRVASSHGARAFFVAKEVLRKCEIASHGDAIHHLDLPCQVVSPESLWQIRREFALQATRCAWEDPEEEEE